MASFSELLERFEAQDWLWKHHSSPPPDAAEDLLPFVRSLIGPGESIESNYAAEVLQQLRDYGEASKAAPGSPKWILYIEQRGCCAICHAQDDMSNKYYRLEVDHDYDTDLIRGLLCGPCNRYEPDNSSDEMNAYRRNPPARDRRWPYKRSRRGTRVVKP